MLKMKMETEFRTPNFYDRRDFDKGRFDEGYQHSMTVTDKSRPSNEKKTNQEAVLPQYGHTQMVDRDQDRNVMQMVFPNPHNPKNDMSSVQFSYDMLTDQNNVTEPAVNTYPDPLSNNAQKRRKGRPKKSLSCLPTKRLDKDPLKKKTKLSPIQSIRPNKLKNRLTGTQKELDEMDALSLAIEMGYENPYEKIVIKGGQSCGKDKTVEKDGESSKDGSAQGDGSDGKCLKEKEDAPRQTSPIEIIQQVIDYKRSGKCKCLTELSVPDIASHRLEITLLDRQSRDFVMMGLLRTAVVATRETARNHTRVRNRFNYRIMSTKICHKCFLFMNNIRGKYMKNLKKHFSEHGVTSRIHGNLGRQPYHAIRSSDITDVVEFINRYASAHGVPAQRFPKNPKAKRIIRLPPSDNFTAVYRQYKELCEQTGKREFALTTFKKIWNLHVPNVKMTLKDIGSPAKAPAASTSSQQPENKNIQGHNTLKRILKTKMDNMNSSSTAQPPEPRASIAQKTQNNLPYDFTGGDLSHNQVMPLSMYLNEGENPDPLPYSYIFSPNTAPMAHHLQTSSSSGAQPSAVMKTNTAQSSGTGQHTPGSLGMNPSLMHLAHGDTFHPSSIPPEKHLLLLEAGSNQLHMPQFGQKNAMPVYSQSSSISAPAAHSGTSGQQQNMGSVSSSLSTLTQQIHMSLYQ